MAKLPVGWEERVIRLQDKVYTRGKSGLCIELHDLAASKLAAFREKDLEFVNALLEGHAIKASVLLERIDTLSIDDETRERLQKWTAAHTFLSC